MERQLGENEYKIKTLDDILDYVPDDRIDYFLEDLKNWFVNTKKVRETLNFQHDGMIWINDGKHDVSLSIYIDHTMK